MLLRAGILSHPKRGNSAGENEDAHYPKSVEGYVRLDKAFVCAIADGATETSYSSLWADLLVETFVACEGDESKFETRLPEIRACWGETVWSKALPWYAQEKVTKGAFAALVGLVIVTTDTGLAWRSIAIGDSCLFHVRDHQLQVAFPVSTLSHLRERPALLSSNPAADGRFPELARKLSGDLIVGDRLYLVTDAVAAWVFASLETESKPFEQIDQMLRTAGSFPEWLDRLWESRSLKNDDCTIFWIEVVA